MGTHAGRAARQDRIAPTNYGYATRRRTIPQIEVRHEIDRASRPEAVSKRIHARHPTVSPTGRVAAARNPPTEVFKCGRLYRRAVGGGSNGALGIVDALANRHAEPAARAHETEDWIKYEHETGECQST